MLARGVNHKWDACPRKGSTQAPVHPHIKLSKYRTRIIWAWWKLAWRYSHVSSERFSHYKSLSRLVLCYKKDWATLLHLIYFCYLLPITNYLITNYLLPIISVLAENTLLKTVDPRTPMGPKPLSVQRGAEIARRADRGEAHDRFTQLRCSPER